MAGCDLECELNFITPVVFMPGKTNAETAGFFLK